MVHCSKRLVCNIYISENRLNSTVVCRPELSFSGTWIDLENKILLCKLTFLSANTSVIKSAV